MTANVAEDVVVLADLFLFGISKPEKQQFYVRGAGGNLVDPN